MYKDFKDLYLSNKLKVAVFGLDSKTISELETEYSDFDFFNPLEMVDSTLSSWKPKDEKYCTDINKTDCCSSDTVAILADFYNAHLLDTLSCLVAAKTPQSDVALIGYIGLPDTIAKNYIAGYEATSLEDLLKWFNDIFPKCFTKAVSSAN